MTSHVRAGTRRLLSVAALVAAATIALSAQAPAAKPAPDATLPSATEVLQRYRAAIGGEAAIRKHTSRTTIGTFEIKGQGIKGDMKVLAVAPDRMRLTITLAALGNIERGYDGHIGWALDPMVGPRVLAGRELDELRHSSDFYDDLHDPASFSAMTVVAKGPFEGLTCYEVKLVRTSGFEYTEFFDVTTGLLAGVKMNATSQMGTTPVTTTTEAYKAFGGVLTPTISHQKMMDVESVMTLTDISFDAIDPKAFDLPVQIAALVRQQK